MEVRKIEQPPGTLTKIEFVNVGDEDFKGAVAQWIRDNYPSMSFQEFFTRLEEFRLGVCRIDMT